MRNHTLAAAILLTGCTVANLDATNSVGSRDRIQVGVAETKRVAKLRHDPQLILKAVARRMGIRLRPEVPLPGILLESRTPLQRMQAAAERQWGFRPEVFANAYAAAENRIYLIDDAHFYERHERTLDDALAHEYVHYLQARYLKDGFDSEWSEAAAIAMQNWFRKVYMAPILAATAAGRLAR